MTHGSTARVLRVGTRGSALALAQSGTVAAAIAEQAGGRVELVRIRTEGDINTGPLATIGGTGVFVTAVRTALLAGDVDVIVHSFKDLPTAPVAGIELAAVPVRESPADALCARDGLQLADLPPGATVGTGSPRRAAQLLSQRPDLSVVPLRGNIDTRLRAVSSGALDAVVLALAGLQRLGRTGAATEVLGPPIMLPAPAQGALAVETRSERDQWYSAALATLDHPQSRRAALAERALLAGLEAGCTAPVGAFAEIAGPALTLTAVVIAVDGSAQVREGGAGRWDDDETAMAVGRALADRLLHSGAAGLLGVRS